MERNPELLSPDKYNELQPSTESPQLHLSARDGRSAHEATMMVFHKMADGTLFCEVFPHKDKEKYYNYDMFTFDDEARKKLIHFLNDKTTY